MYTRCPNCQTYFKISADQLTKASGKVRCGQCKKVFNSLGNLLEELPVALADRGKTKPTPTLPPLPPLPPSSPKAAAARIPSIPVSAPVASTPKPRALPTATPPASTARPSPQKPAAALPPPAAPPPPKPAPRVTRAVEPQARSTLKRKVTDENIVLYNDEEKPKATKSSSRDALDLTSADKIENVQAGPYSSVRDLVIYPGPPKDKDEGDKELIRPDLTNAFWVAGVAFLFILFILQYSYYMRDDLARYAELRPMVQKLCAIAQCELPLQQSLEQIKLTQRDIISHPRVKGALLINAVIVSNATFAQPFPIMQISLSNISGKVIAKRRFQPTEYLDADVNIRRGMAPGNSVQIVLEIADPGKDAVNFEFAFF